MSCNILRNYLVNINPHHANLSVHVTRSPINAPLIIIPGPNGSGISGYGNTKYKIITSLPICRGEFLYLLSCSIVLVSRLVEAETSTQHATFPGYGLYASNNVACYGTGRGGRWGEGRRGPRHQGREEKRRPAITIQASRRLRHQGDTKTPSRS